MASSSRTPAVSAEEDFDDPYSVRSIHQYYDELEQDDASEAGESSQSSQSSSQTQNEDRANGHTDPRARDQRSEGVRGTTRGQAADATDDTARQRRDDQRVNWNAAEDARKSAAQEEQPLFGSGTGRSQANGGLPGAGASGEGALRDGQEEVEEDEDEDDRDGYYALLNVQKDATEDQIRDAYRALAVVLHPDKHNRSPHLKESAESRFRAIQHAYEVLIDAEKRSIYDHFGVKGLQQDWSLVQRSGAGGPRSAAELRDEWERIARKKREDQLENLVQSRGEYTATINAWGLFCAANRVPRSKEVLKEVGRELARKEMETGVKFQNGTAVELPPVTVSERWACVGLTTIGLRHGWEMPFMLYSRILFNGSMASHNGVGSGSLSGTIRTRWNSKFTSEVTSSLTRPRAAVFKGQYELSQYSFMNLVATARSPAVPPELNLTFGQRLADNSALTGFTTFRTGSYTVGSWRQGIFTLPLPPGITVGVSDEKPNGNGWNVITSLAIEDQIIGLTYSCRPAILGSAKCGFKLVLSSTSGISVQQSLDRKVTENTRIGFGVNVEIPSGGVSLRLRFSRLGQRLTIPIQLSPEYRADLASACTVLPAFGLLALEHLYIRPSRRKKAHTRLASLRKQHAELIAQRKQAAVEAIDVLRTSARKKAHAEWRRDGLVVVQAFYGKRDQWPARPGVDSAQDISAELLFAQTWEGEDRGGRDVDGSTSVAVEQDWWDVTIPVQMLVHKSQLIVAGGRAKHKLLGFFDPCMGERKHLIVRYLFRGQLHETVVDDVTQLTAPLRAHQL